MNRYICKKCGANHHSAAPTVDQMKCGYCEICKVPLVPYESQKENTMRIVDSIVKRYVSDNVANEIWNALVNALPEDGV